MSYRARFCIDTRAEERALVPRHPIQRRVSEVPRAGIRHKLRIGNRTPIDIRCDLVFGRRFRVDHKRVVMPLFRARPREQDVVVARPVADRDPEIRAGRRIRIDQEPARVVVEVRRELQRQMIVRAISFPLHPKLDRQFARPRQIDIRVSGARSPIERSRRRRVFNQTARFAKRHPTRDFSVRPTHDICERRTRGLPHRPEMGHPRGTLDRFSIGLPKRTRGSRQEHEKRDRYRADARRPRESGPATTPTTLLTPHIRNATIQWAPEHAGKLSGRYDGPTQKLASSY